MKENMLTKISQSFINCVLVMIMICFSISSMGQVENKSNKIEKVNTDTYYYSFSSNDLDVLEKTTAEIEELKSVVKVKLNFKGEKKQGQFIILVQEPERATEGEELFSIKWVKDILENNKLTPTQYSYE